MKMIKHYLLFLLVALSVLKLRADEGIWLPMLLEQLNEQEMKTMGLKITAEDIYSINHSSMKDGILLFGTGCTGSLISPEGLLITNHHCGLSLIQKHSSLEHDYLKQGFWAMNKAEELLNPGLTVTFIVRMEDVSERVLAEIGEEMALTEKKTIIDARIKEIIAEATEGTHYEAVVKPFYQGNEYYLIVSEKYLDVRLVGAPPNGIGSYGGDVDNWMWPRHSGDFSLFRIYTAPDGSPAPYSPQNVPMKSRYFFPVSTQGVKEGDFAMIYGFPYRTQEYLSSYGIQYVEEVEHPSRIALRHERLRIIDREMSKSDKVRIQYASKQSGIANGYKKWQGAVRGLRRAGAVSKKQAYEAEFMRRVSGKEEWRAKYSHILPELKSLYQQFRPVARHFWYFQEAAYAIELIDFAAELGELTALMQGGASEAAIADARSKALRRAKGFFNNYEPKIDREIMAVMLRMYADSIPASQQPEVLREIVNSKKYQGDFELFAQEVFTESAFTNGRSFESFLTNADLRQIEKDPAYQLMAQLVSHYYSHILPPFQQLKAQIDELNRLYMQAQREVFSEKRFYPDANFSLRLTYGKVQGYQPRDAVVYRYYTTLSGAIDKYRNHPEKGVYDLPERLMQLYQDKDYGPYGQEGEMRIGFITTTHTTGGNSGSPVFDGEGRLIGLYFDRNWEGTMSDIFYDPEQCRGISVDIRYILFLIDKYAGAGYLLNEMKLE